MYLKKVTTTKQARNKTKALHPSTEYLFGGRTGELCTNLRNSSELNPLKHKPRPLRFPSGWKHPGQGAGYPKSYYKPGYRGGNSSGSRGRGGGRGRGNGRGKQLSTFKED